MPKSTFIAGSQGQVTSKHGQSQSGALLVQEEVGDTWVVDGESGGR